MDKFCTYRRPIPGGQQSDSLAGITTIRRVETTQRAVALTFDDGSHDTYTQEKLDILARFGASATFFLLGQEVNRLPEIARRIAEAGHDIGNHSYSHPFLTKLLNSGIYREIGRAKDSILRATGSFDPFFRPPYGYYNEAVLQAAAALGYKWNVLWDVDPRDWASPGTWTIISRVMSEIQPGSIVLLHDWQKQSVRALPEILVRLGCQGFRAVSLSELISMAEPLLPPPPPPVYRPGICRTLRVTVPYMRGPDVEAVQNALGDHGFDPGPIDGIYGPLTEAAVKAFQRSKGMPVTGVVGVPDYQALTIECP